MRVACPVVHDQPADPSSQRSCTWQAPGTGRAYGDSRWPDVPEQPEVSLMASATNAICVRCGQGCVPPSQPLSTDPSSVHASERCHRGNAPPSPVPTCCGPARAPADGDTCAQYEPRREHNPLHYQRCRVYSSPCPEAPQMAQLRHSGTRLRAAATGQQPRQGCGCAQPHLAGT